MKSRIYLQHRVVLQSMQVSKVRYIIKNELPYGSELRSNYSDTVSDTAA